MLKTYESPRTRQIEKMVSVVDVHDTDEASLGKHTSILITVDRVGGDSV